MNNPNPFVPKGSLLEQQSHRRSRMKLGVFCVLAVGIAGLMAMLIQGCKRNAETDSMPVADTNTPVADTNTVAMEASNSPVAMPYTNVTPVAIPPVETAGTEYVVVKGDTLAVIAKKNGVTLKALEAANPGVVPTKLKVGQKLSVPAATASPAASATTGADTGGETYTVKSGDTLTRIAKQFGTTIKAIESANNLSTGKIKVGQKLKIPAKTEAAAPVSPAPVTTPAH